MIERDGDIPPGERRRAARTGSLIGAEEEGAVRANFCAGTPRGHPAVGHGHSPGDKTSGVGGFISDWRELIMV